MRRWCRQSVLFAVFVHCGLAQTIQSWAEVRERFVAANPTLIAGRIGISQSRAAEVTAYLRPNPDLTGTLDQINPFSTQPSPNGSGENVYRPFANALPFGSISYLQERQHKRELQRDSAQRATAVVRLNYLNLIGSYLTAAAQMNLAAGREVIE